MCLNLPLKHEDFVIKVCLGVYLHPLNGEVAKITKRKN